MKKKQIMAYVVSMDILFAGVFSSTFTVRADETEMDNAKEEVVYIITSADGEVENVNVVNIFGKGNITDYGSYSGVKMLNTTESINIDGDKVTFSTTKDKVYYQGTLDNVEIPWSINIAYILNGEKVEASELAGQTGNLQIRIIIEKNEKCQIDFYDDYALQAVVTLDTEKCRNIIADGATIANVGVDKQISYTILPGKGLDAVISTDVTDYEMEAITINGVRLNLDIDVDDSELMNKVTEIMDASKKLSDGAAELCDKSEELVDGSKELYAGTSTLNDGIKSLYSGIGSLSNGVSNMQGALSTLNSKSETLKNASKNISDALGTMQSEMSGISPAADQLAGLVNASGEIKNAIESIYNGELLLQGALSFDSYKAAMNENGLNIEELQTKNDEVIAALSVQIQDMQMLKEQLENSQDYDTNETAKAQVTQLNEQINNTTDIISIINADSIAINGTGLYMNTVSQNVTELLYGIDGLKTNYEKVDLAINEMASRLSIMYGNFDNLKTSIDTLSAEYKNFDAGLNEYTEGVNNITNAYGQLIDGTNAVLDSSGRVAEGSEELSKGTMNLYNGVVKFSDGTHSLKDGAGEFYEKTDGMDEKISTNIDETLSSISGGKGKTVSFVSEKNKNVTSVQFVIKTGNIKMQEVEVSPFKEEEKLNFWQKVMKLFGR